MRKISCERTRKFESKLWIDMQDASSKEDVFFGKAPNVRFTEKCTTDVHLFKMWECAVCAMCITLV